MSTGARLFALCGAQFGSEGKGVIAHHLRDEIDVAVRVGGPNAGHTFKHNGRLWKMRAVPCGWTNPNTACVIGRGAVVHPLRLEEELEMTGAEVFVDRMATLIPPDAHHVEAALGLEERIGSTLEGVGEARQARLARDPELCRFVHQYGWPSWVKRQVHVVDTVEMLNRALDDGASVLLEGTQGFGLSLYHGQWPFVTSADTTPMQLCADVGVTPPPFFIPILVARTFPIRVGGNSGPLHGELSWEQLSEQIGRKVSERTTVTNRLRRVGEWDDELFRRAVQVCRPAFVALTFLDYLFPEVEGKTEWEKLSKRAQHHVQWVEDKYGVNVLLIGTGGPDFAVIDRRGEHALR